MKRRTKTKTCVYMAVTADKYELPLIVEDKQRDLAKKMGLSRETISSCLYRPEKNTGARTGIKFIRVDLDEDLE